MSSFISLILFPKCSVTVIYFLVYLYIYMYVCMCVYIYIYTNIQSGIYFRLYIDEVKIIQNV